jgi:hypothetical protein
MKLLALALLLTFAAFSHADDWGTLAICGDYKLQVNTEDRTLRVSTDDATTAVNYQELQDSDAMTVEQYTSAVAKGDLAITITTYYSGSQKEFPDGQEASATLTKNGQVQQLTCTANP